MECETRLRHERQELSQHERDLHSTEEQLRNAKKKKKKAKKRKKKWAKVVAGACVVASFGAAAPLTAPLPVAAMGGATAYLKSQREAEAFIHRCRGWIEDVRRKIHTNESRIGSICSAISDLENQKSRYLEERSHLETEKGRMKKVFVFLQDAKVFWSDFSSTTQNCIYLAQQQK